MTAGDVLDQVARFNNIDIDDELGFDWINLFQQDVAFHGGPLEEETYAVIVADTGYALPADFVTAIDIVDSDDVVIDTSKITIKGGKLYLSKGYADGVTMTYRANPADVNATTDELDVVTRFQYIAYLYLIAMYYDMEGEGDPEESGLAERWFQRYEYKKEQIISQLLEVMEGPVSVTDVLPKRSRTVESELDWRWDNE